jgi:hypothetical protein
MIGSFTNSMTRGTYFRRYVINSRVRGLSVSCCNNFHNSQILVHNRCQSSTFSNATPCRLFSASMGSSQLEWPGRNKHGEVCKLCLKLPKGLFCRYHEPSVYEPAVVPEQVAVTSTCDIDTLTTKVLRLSANSSIIPPVESIIQCLNSIRSLRLSSPKHDAKCSELTKSLSKLLIASNADLTMNQLRVIHNSLLDFPNETTLQEAYIKTFLASSDPCCECLGDFVMGMQSFRFGASEVTTFIYTINAKLRVLNAEGVVMPPDQIAKCLFALRRFTFTSQKEVRWVTGSLIPQVERTTKPLNADFVHMAFHGLKYRSSADKLVHTLVGVLAERMEKLLSLSRIDVKVASDMLTGMGSMRAENPNIQRALKIIADILSHRDSYLQMTPSLIATSLHGMRCMTAGDRYVSDVLAALCNHIEHRSDLSPFKAKDIAMCMSGLRIMDSELVVVRYVLSALATEISSGLEDDFTSAMLSETIVCLEGMIAHKEVTNILTALTSKLGTCMGMVNGVQISRALQGMRAMDTSNQEVGFAMSEFLALMTPSVMARTDLVALTFTARNLVGAVQQGFAPAVRGVSQLLSRIHKEIARPEFSGITCYREENIVGEGSLLQLIWQTMCFLSMSEYLDDASRDYIQRIQNAVKPLLANIREDTIVSLPERKFGDRIEKLILQNGKYSHIKVSRGETFHGFKTDIIIRVTSKDGKNNSNSGSDSDSGSGTVDAPVEIHNIEIDGSSHYLARKRIGYTHRDAFLHSLGVKVHRVDLTQYMYHSKELNDAVFNYVHKLMGEDGGSSSRASTKITWSKTSGGNNWRRWKGSKKSNSAGDRLGVN